MKDATTADTEIRTVLEGWAEATRQNRREDVLVNHLPDVVIFDVLPPMKYESAAEYRRSWDDWQPDTQGDGIFELKDLCISAGRDVAFAHCFIRCGGTTAKGKTFEDVVRATFCLRNVGGRWKVAHQHVSKPLG